MPGSRTGRCGPKMAGASSSQAPGAIGSLFEQSIGGEQGARLLLESPQHKIPTSISRDGRFLLYTSATNGSTRLDVWVLPLTGERKPYPLIRRAFDQDAGPVLARRAMGGVRVQRIRSSRSSGPPVCTRVHERRRERGGERDRVQVRRHGAPMESRRQGTLLRHAGRRDRLGSCQRSPCTGGRLADDAVPSSRHCGRLGRCRRWEPVPRHGAGASAPRRRPFRSFSTGKERSTTSDECSLAALAFGCAAWHCRDRCPPGACVIDPRRKLAHSSSVVSQRCVGGSGSARGVSRSISRRILAHRQARLCRGDRVSPSGLIDRSAPDTGALWTKSTAASSLGADPADV